MRSFSRIAHIPHLSEFMRKATPTEPLENLNGLKYYIKTYGCQMNVNDTEIVNSILQKSGLTEVETESEAELVLLNTCSIRDKAEAKVKQKLRDLKHLNAKVGVLGCMAERLRSSLIEEKLAHLVVGPDAYRSLPELVKAIVVEGQQEAMDVQLSLEETYSDITPVRHNKTSAFISVMRGCNNMCSFCVVPFTRGRERSRPLSSIVEEAKSIAEAGVKEITLLGQNVNSYCDMSTPLEVAHMNTPGFSELYKLRQGPGARFEHLLASVAEAVPNVRIRFTSPHPKDFPQGVIEAIKQYPNICNQVHLPLQSGSDAVLNNMRRLYTQKAFLELADRLREEIPGVALSTDIIAGFCGETEEDHQETLKVVKHVEFEQAFMFAYSMRSKTHAYNTMTDTVPEEIKKRRLSEVIEAVQELQFKKNQREIGRVHEVLVEGPPKKPGADWTGRTDTNKRVVGKGPSKEGSLIKVHVDQASAHTLIGHKI